MPFVALHFLHMGVSWYIPESAVTLEELYWKAHRQVTASAMASAHFRPQHR